MLCPEITKLYKATLIHTNIKECNVYCNVIEFRHASQHIDSLCDQKNVKKRLVLRTERTSEVFRAKVDPSCHRFTPGRSSWNAPLSNPQIRPSTENRNGLLAEPSILGPNEIAGQQPILKHLSLKTRPFFLVYVTVLPGHLLLQEPHFYSMEHLQEKPLLNSRPCDQLRQNLFPIQCDYTTTIINYY